MLFIAKHNIKRNKLASTKPVNIVFLGALKLARTISMQTHALRIIKDHTKLLWDSDASNLTDINSFSLSNSTRVPANSIISKFILIKPTSRNNFIILDLNRLVSSASG